MIHPTSAQFDCDTSGLLKLCVGAPNNEKLRSIWSDYFTSEAQHLRLYSKGTNPVGLIGVEQINDQTVVIRHIAVAPHIQCRGLGRHMVDQLQYSTVIAETHKEAVGFYQKSGFCVRSLGEKYPGTERFECVKTNQPSIASQSPSAG